MSYPGLKSFPQHELAKKQMVRPGGLISFELEGGMDAGLAFMNRLELVTRAVSLGDAETLVQHPASMTHASVPRDTREALGITDGLVRISAGLEDLDDLKEDLSRALDAI